MKTETIRNKTTNLYTEWKPLVDGLSDSDAGKLLKDILKYQSNEEVSNNNPVWLFIKSKIDDYNEQGTQISKARSEAGKRGMASRWGITNDNNCYQMITNDNKNNNKIKENKIKENKINTLKENIIKEKHPSLEDVKAYCIERKNNVDAERFYDYYTSNGWKVGKNPMKDWKAAVRTWEKNTTEKEPQNIKEQKKSIWEKNKETIRQMKERGEL